MSQGNPLHCTLSASRIKTRYKHGQLIKVSKNDCQQNRLIHSSVTDLQFRLIGRRSMTCNSTVHCLIKKDYVRILHTPDPSNIIAFSATNIKCRLNEATTYSQNKCTVLYTTHLHSCTTSELVVMRLKKSCSSGNKCLSDI